MANKFEPAGAIVTDIMAEMVDVENPAPSAGLPKIDQLARNLNRARASVRPAAPTHLQFVVSVYTARYLASLHCIDLGFGVSANTEFKCQDK